MSKEERRFPILGGLSVKWEYAERAYRGYTWLFGHDQSLEHLAERGGFGLQEFVRLVGVSMVSDHKKRQAFEQREIGDQAFAACLYRADIRVER